MSKLNAKETLFKDFFHAAFNTLEALENQYAVKGIRSQVFGASDEVAQQEAALRASRPWATLSNLYDYAYDGIVGKNGADAMAVVLNGSDVIKLATSEDFWPSTRWNDIVAMADGRYALDDGQSIEASKVALLASVDVRTVRNAISSGELSTFKKEGDTLVSNDSARRWLRGRRGFKPTVNTHEDANESDLDLASTPVDFGAILAARRRQLKLESPDPKSSGFHPCLRLESLAEIEAGIFLQSLDAVFPLADYYLVDRKRLLKATMRVFFCEELRLLSADADGRGGDSDAAE